MTNPDKELPSQPRTEESGPSTARAAGEACCTPSAQEQCCTASSKAACCGPQRQPGTCGCQ